MSRSSTGMNMGMMIGALILIGCPEGGEATTADTTGSLTGADATTETDSDGTSTGATTGDPTSGTSTTDEGSTAGAPGICGDGALDPGEACDDGNADAADACTATCEDQRVLSVTMGFEHACVVLSGGAVKCWGKNLEGQLGLEDTLGRGGKPGQMGDALPFVALGGTVVQVDAGFAST